jgi:hypothetical protein
MVTMKRYRLLQLHFDRGPLLLEDIQPEWDEQVRAVHLRNQAHVRERLVHVFGAEGMDDKRQNYVDFGPTPMSVLAYHNAFYEQLRVAFIMGSYYPALTAACALGERILNHLVRVMSAEFPDDTKLSSLASKDFPKWLEMLDALVAHDVLLPDAAVAFRELREKRNAALHFEPEVDKSARALALEALGPLNTIIEEQFSAIGTQPWFIQNAPGLSLIRRDAEELPFVRRVLIPQAMHVGPYHEVEYDQATGYWNQVDPFDYEDLEITDAEYLDLMAKGPATGNRRASAGL